jgi:transposase
MYMRTVKSRTKDGPVEYIQLCHNVWDRELERSRTQVVYNFGRADQLDVDGIRRLIRSLSRFLPADEVMMLQEKLGQDWPFEFLGSRQLGGSALLDGLWKRLGIDRTLKRLLGSREYQTPIERLIFGMVANRALAPSSKLHMEHWVETETYIEGLLEVEVHTLYRAMDFLLEATDRIQHDVFFSVADLFNLEVDVLFLDTTTTYFEVESEDCDEEADGEVVTEGLRKRGKHSKDSRPDLPQVVVAFAVTRTGIPVRCWVWPGNTVDQEVVEEVKRDLNTWKLGRVILVEDTGFNSEANRRTLQGAGGHYIIGEKLRVGSKAAPTEALKRGGRYQELENGLRFKEVVVGGDSEARRRFVVVQNPTEAERDRKKRADIVAEVEKRLAKLKQLDGEPHEKAACDLRSHHVYGRFIRQSKTGKLCLNKGKIKAEEQFDGKYVVSTSDDGLPAKDVVMGYKQLAEIERVFGDLKHLIDIRPVRHRLPDRIRAHVLLCWLAMLLIRIAENETGQTWFQMKKALATMQMGIHQMREGEMWERNPVSAKAKEIFTKLQVKIPPRYLKLPTPKSESA